MRELMEDELNQADFVYRIINGSERLLDLVVRTNSGISEYRYKKLRLIHYCCHVECDEQNMTFKISVVARGVDGSGPFLFVWPFDTVNPDQAACSGMPLTNVFEA